GLGGAGLETCNGRDDDCDGTVDDNLTDVWVAQSCCPTGSLSDCTNTTGGTRCALGAYACVGGVRACTGGIAKSPETCNGADDDCNGAVDDVAGVGNTCSAAGVKTQGAGTARFIW